MRTKLKPLMLEPLAAAQKALAVSISAAIACLIPVAANAQRPPPDPVGTIYETGVIPAPRERALRFSRPPKYRDFLPAEVYLGDHTPYVGNQGQQGSCVAWAVGYTARSYYKSRIEKVDLLKRPVRTQYITSPAYLYNIALTDPKLSKWASENGKRIDCKTGTYIETSLEILTNGALSLLQYPYSERRCAPPPTEAQKRLVVDFKIDYWDFIDPTDLDTIKGEIAKGNPVIFTLELAKSFMQFRSSGVYHRRLSEPTNAGFHAMVLIGYDDQIQAFHLQNSWGTGWGDVGYADISYDTFYRDAREAYVMRFNVPPDVLRPPPQATNVAAIAVARERRKNSQLMDPLAPPGPDLTTDVAAFSAECAKVNISAEGGRTIARGFVGKTADLDRLRQHLAGRNADINVEIRPWPQCEALLTLDRALTAPDRPSISVIGGASILTRGQTLALEVLAPDKPSHIHVAYFQADGSVVHLVQADAGNPRAAERGARMTFGDGREGRPVFQVSAPYGREMAIVLASRAPIFTEPRPRLETEREFLSALRRALISIRGVNVLDQEVSAAYVSVVTKEN